MLGGPRLRQHVVEFIRGTGVVTDGVVDATSLNGPYTWQVPEGVTELVLDACGGGTSGQAGANVTGGITSAGGGCGGAAGNSLVGNRVVVRPRATLTISLAAGGAAQAVGTTDLNSGGDTTIEGLLAANLDATGTNRVRVRGTFAYRLDPPTASSSGQGLGSSGGTGEGSNNFPGAVERSALTGYVGQVGSLAGGGAGNASGAVAGSQGGSIHGYTSPYGTAHGIENARAAGSTSGTVSRGGGGQGMPSPFGRGGDGGSTGAGQNSPSYGAGGGGGAGGFGGGAGGDGYVRFTYWSAD